MRFLLLTCWFVTLFPASVAWASEAISFRSDIAPILLDHCLACHGPRKAEGGYRVDSYDQLFKPGDTGETPVAVAEDQQSELFRRVSTEDESERMPAESEPLTAEQIGMIQTWIESGAKFDGPASGDPLSIVIPAAHHPDPPESYARPIPITAICFSPDGTQLLVGGYHELTLWDVNQPRLIRRIKNIGQRVFSIVFEAEGKTIAVGCGEPGKSGELRLVDFQSGKVTGVLARTSDVVLDAAFRPDSDQIAVASADSLIRIYNVETMQLVRTIASHADWVSDIAWSDDGSRLVSGSRDKSAKVFDALSGDLVASYLGHGAAVRGVSILADGKQVISTGGDQKLHRWQIEDAKPVAQLSLGGDAFKSVRGDNVVFVPCADKRLRCIQLSDNKVSREFQGHSDWVISAAVQPAGRYVAGGSFNGEVRIWDTADGSLLHSWLAKP